jgi:radical SAM protein (TIGR01212 family)
LASTTRHQPPLPWGNWRNQGLRYHRLNFFLRKKFGRRVQKLSLDGGFACPNADGTLGSGGCVFCNVRSFSPSRRDAPRPIAEQIAQARQRLTRRYRTDRFIAYFQPGTNTYGPLDRLRSLYEEALAQPGIVGLAIGTRPDCVPDAILDLLADVARRTWVVIEYGLQTIHRRSLQWMNRGHEADAFIDAVRRSRARQLNAGAHVILGLPGESRRDMLQTARLLASLPLHCVKVHNLYAVRDTPLAEMVTRGEVRLPTLEQFVAAAVDFLEVLPPTCVIDRIGGDAPAQWLVAPLWCLDKAGLRSAIEAEMVRRDTWQGKHCRTADGGGEPQSP